MSRRTQARVALSAAVLVSCWFVVPGALGQANRLPQALAAHRAPRVGAPPARPAAAPAFASRPCTSVSTDPTTNLTLGKSHVVQLDFPAARIVVGGQPSSSAAAPVPIEQVTGAAARPPAAPPASASNGVADTEITLLSPTELFMLGRRTGSMNIVVQGTDGRCVVKDIVVAVDPQTLQSKLRELMPEEMGIKVRGAENSLVLTGTVSSAARLDQIMSVAGSYEDPKRVVNLLQVGAPQQVMLEVKIAEVSKTLLDNFGLDFSRLVTSSNGVASSIISGIIGGGAGVLGRFAPNTGGGVVNGSASGSVSLGNGSAVGTLSSVGHGGTLLGLNAQKKDGIIRVLAEPNILAISGQQASFLSGGKIFIPVAQGNSAGGSVITLEEKEFGVGLKFTPTVLDGNRINLKLVSEASDLSQTGSPFTSFNGTTAILPSLTTRRVDTTVQLADGQSFVVAGLIKNNLTQALDKFPGLGDVPVMGALFRSTEFATDQTELMFVVTPHLVKPLTVAVTLPTDNHVPPTANDSILRGSGEGVAPAAARPQASAMPAPASPTAPAPVAPAVVTQLAPAPVRPTAETTPSPLPPAAPPPTAPAAVAEVATAPVLPHAEAAPEPLPPVLPATGDAQPDMRP